MCILKEILERMLRDLQEDYREQVYECDVVRFSGNLLSDNILECFYTKSMKFDDGIFYADNIPEMGDHSFLQEASHFAETVTDTSLWHKHRDRCIVSVVKRWLPRGCGFVDVGGGNGHIANLLQSEGYDVALVEPVCYYVQNAKRRGVKNIVNGLFDASIVKPISVPAIGLFDVLEHIENDGDFISGVLPLLGDKGKIVVAVPAYDFLRSEKDDKSMHFRRYTIHGLRNLFLHNKCDILQETYFFSFLLPLVFLLKALPYRIFKKKHNAASIDLKRLRKEHTLGNNAMFSLLAIERYFISHGKKIPFGASCLIVAQKNESAHMI